MLGEREKERGEAARANNVIKPHTSYYTTNKNN